MVKTPAGWAEPSAMPDGEGGGVMDVRLWSAGRTSAGMLAPTTTTGSD